ncbi:hypothetical protein OSB04_032252 [Centaurea solstitialis]|uniref:Reverse transcriptase Ty1/copia-type domain-containing protein n=1 Tax=Centaurea solstitialis TaxID=347529 RepID=A0AA38SAN6_9ASTR|nr:hypothetical protein OSB04_032252 [Centaurea solstitialis]
MTDNLVLSCPVLSNPVHSCPVPSSLRTKRYLRILMAISAYFNYEIWQMDVKTAFLNGKLTEDVYMEQPEGFEDPKNPNKVCKLLKSIYGLKQASRSWNLHFDERIKEFGFTKSEFEPCVYTKFSGSIVTFLVLYVDDILLIGNDVPTLQSVKSWLSKCLAAYILGIKIYRNRSKWLIGLSQSTYIDKILKRFRMDESKKEFIPMQHGIVLSKTQCPISSQDQDRMKSIPYASAIGSIMYAMLCTRPDVAYSVSVTSRYQQNPGEPHWVAVKNILKYLRRTKDMFLVFGGSEDEISVTGYSDASFQTDRDDFRSQSEYIAASDAAKEAVWLRNFLSDLRVVASISRPIDIFCDNSGAVAQAKEPREHHKSRHVLRKYHLIREIIGRGDVRICKIPTEENVADPLTKPLARVKHEAHASSIGMKYLDARIEVARSRHGITMCQRKYILDLLAETRMLNCLPADTPIEVNHGLRIHPDQTPTNKERYQRLVGKLIYLSHTRPEIAYAVSVVSRFMHAPSEDHMNVVHRILRYLKAAPGKGLWFRKNQAQEVLGYTDADWSGDKSDGKSTSGYFTYVEGNLVTWRSKKQKVVARSSEEAEYRGMVHGVCELIWIKRILRDLGVSQSNSMKLYCDNEAAVKIANNPVQHDRTKHVELDRHFIKDHLEKKSISLPFVNSKDQLADMLTKAVCGRVFQSSLNKLGMLDIHSPA